MQFNNFEDLFNQLFTEAYHIEKHTLEFLPKMVAKTHSNELREALNHHLDESKKHFSRLEQILKKQNVQIEQNQVCPIDTIVQAAENSWQDNEASPLLDAAFIAHMQQIEHVEMAIYGTLKEYADQLEDSSIKSLVKETLEEEAKTDTILTKLAEGGFFKEGINVKAEK